MRHTTASHGRALEAHYAFFARLSDPLQDLVLSAPLGTLEQRAHTLSRWYDDLMAGRQPEPSLAWPAPALDRALLAQLDALELPRLCRQDEALCLEVLTSMVDALCHYQTRVSERLKALVEAWHQAHPPQQRKKGARAAKLPAEQLAAQASSESVRAVTAHMGAAWEARVALWRRLLALFGPLAAQLGRGWDWSLGLLRSQSWRALEDAHALVAKLAPLRELIDQLGRLRDDPDAMSVFDQVEVMLARPILDHWTPLTPVETRGLTRSDDLSRMLPSEAVLLTHPVLRMLFHARRQEHALMSYLREGPVEVLSQEVGHQQVRRPMRRRGPVILCVDTSGSMHGEPERVAKAIALEVARRCAAQHRACLLYMFSGPGQIQRHTLDLHADGLAELITFLLTSFQGGTEPQGPLQRALDDLRAEDWQRADLLLLSDGEFALSPAFISATRASLEAAQAKLQGVLLRSSQSAAMTQVCDHVHLLAKLR